ncbi:four helix bundle protein [Candidatus Uabimicrobium sp. HlEnr_7]|uniref:four helix bundle protein n=1 Tax=Candidatus Uabimicrobium helgolandensis TaxID=3095367 RepID=UPI00355850B6
MNFNHEKLDVYQVSLEYTKETFNVMEKMPSGYSYLKDQLKRASLSMPLNIAGGNAKFSKKEKARFFSIARSANECSAVFDVAKIAQIIDSKEKEKIKKLLYRIICIFKVNSLIFAHGISIHDHEPQKSNCTHRFFILL